MALSVLLRQLTKKSLRLKYHRDTLKLCVEKANQDEREILDEERRKKEREEKRISEHYDRINQLSKEIDFDW